MLWFEAVCWNSRDPGPTLHLPLGLATLVASVGVILVQKWAWFLSVVTAAACTLADAYIALNLLLDLHDCLDPMWLTSAGLLAIGIFSLFYLSRKSIRALFGIGLSATKTG